MAVEEKGGRAAVPKVCGGDVELGNFILGMNRAGGTCREAARALLAEIRGVPQTGVEVAGGGARTPGWWYGDWWGVGEHASGRYGSGSGETVWNSQDWGRKFLARNGGSAYIDMNHAELCLPEVLGAHDHVATWHALLLIAREALDRANARLPRGQRIQVLVNNSDGHGSSYGSHVNFQVTRGCWNNLFERKMHYLLYFVSYLASSMVFAGGGKVGSENGQPGADFQLSQRADFMETVVGEQTTWRRPIANSRNESLCGSAFGEKEDGSLDGKLARVHVICLDNTLCHVSSLLKVGVTQIVLAMIEQECVPRRLLLESPLDALHAWSRDVTLGAKARLLDGSERTALEVQDEILGCAARFIAGGRADGLVPRVQEIFGLWEETLGELGRGDFERLAGKLDWVLKFCALDRARGQHALGWDSAEMKQLDHLYGSLDAAEGLYWAYERAGAVQRVVSAGEVERRAHEAPEDTRAWLRAQVLRRVPADSIVRVDWDEIRFRFRRGGSKWPTYSYYTLPMADPCGQTRRECERVLRESATMEAALHRLGLEETDARGRPVKGTEGAGCESACAGTEKRRAPIPLPAPREEDGETGSAEKGEVQGL